MVFSQRLKTLLLLLYVATSISQGVISATHPSVPCFLVREKAPGVVGKFVEFVAPPTKAFPLLSSRMELATSDAAPPR